MPSARSRTVRRVVPGVLLMVGLTGLAAGCATTQQTAARLQLNDARLRVSAAAVRLGPGAATSASVRVGSISLLRAGGGLNAVVGLQNTAGRAVSDLPISVGYTLGRRRVYLNGASGLSYFANHVPRLAPHSAFQWVTDVGGSLPRGARPFARVGARPAVDAGSPSAVDIAVRIPSFRPSRPVVIVTNRSSIPQYQLPVYVILRDGPRVRAAAVTTLGTLAGGASAKVAIALPDPGGRLAVEAPATIFN